MSGAGKPPVLEAVLQAADAAGLGLSVSVWSENSSRCVYASESAARLLGVRPEQLLGHSLRDFLTPESVDKLVVLAGEMIDGQRRHGDVIEVTPVCGAEDGASVLLAYAPTQIDGQAGVLAFMIDAAAQRREAIELETTARRLAELFTHAPDAIVVSRGATVIKANPAAAKMLGLESPEDLVGQSLARFVLPEEHALMGERMERVARGEQLGLMLYRATRADGREMSVEILSFLSEYDGSPAVIGFGRDVTERERMHQQLDQTARLAALGTLAAGVAHELNNPLAAVSLNLEMLERLMASDPRRARMLLEDLKGSVDRMASIVGDLGSFSRSESSSIPDDVSVAAVIEGAVRMTRHATRQRAQVRVELEDLPPVLGDARKLEQVLVNLLVNAVQALPDDRDESANRIVVRGFRAADDQLSIEVEDNGVGISPDAIRRIFEPFFTSKPTNVGTGLGLFICHNVVTGMGGKILVHSSIGEGTRMQLLLPCRGESTPTTQPLPRHESPAPTRRARILVIDDEPALCRSLVVLLDDSHDVTAVSRGAEAIALLKDSPSFDVILCDLMMPEVSGIDIYAELQDRAPTMVNRVVFMTGGTFTERAARFLKSVPNTCLNKPFSYDALQTVIEESLAKKQ